MTEQVFTHARVALSRATLCGEPINDGKRRLYVVYPSEFGILTTPPGPWCHDCAKVLANDPAVNA